MFQLLFARAEKLFTVCLNLYLVNQLQLRLWPMSLPKHQIANWVWSTNKSTSGHLVLHTSTLHYSIQQAVCFWAMSLLRVQQIWTHVLRHSQHQNSNVHGVVGHVWCICCSLP